MIERCFPELRIRHCRHIAAGWENFVLEVNGEYVFRFPMSGGAERGLRRETSIVPELRRHLSTHIPEYVFLWKGGPKYRHWFGGYPKINGETLTRLKLTKARVPKAAREVSRFLRELHSINTRAKMLQSIPRSSSESSLRSLSLFHSKVRKLVYPLLNGKLRKDSESFWQGRLEYMGDVHYKPTFLHGDLGVENMLFDPTTLELTGVLDWSYVQMGDPAAEFAHLFTPYQDLGAAILKNYTIRGPEFRERVQWYVRSEPFYEIMWGIKQDSRKATRWGMDHLLSITFA